MKTVARFFFASVLAIAYLVAPPPAHGELVFSDFVYHPSIAAQPASGQWIKDLAVDGNDLYIGYGDYGANTGPIAVATVNMTTGATGVKVVANTEEINTYRKFNGSLYAPWIDPTNVAGPYSSNQTGTWINTENTEAVHVYDIGVLPNGIQVAVGSSNNLARTAFLGATAWVSRDNGRTWTVEMTDLTSAKDPNVSGFERYYWVAVIGNVAYLQARDQAAIYGQATFPLRTFNGYKWTSQNKSADCFSYEGHQVEVYNGRAYCNNGRIFNGRRSVTKGGINASDFYQHNGVLYAVSNGRIMRLAGSVWTQVATAPNDRVRSLAVTNTHIYVGDGYGHVSRAAYVN